MLLMLLLVLLQVAIQCESVSKTSVASVAVHD